MTTVLLLAAILAVLFYKFVERRHKVMAAWGVLGLVVLGGLFFGAVAVWEGAQRKEQERLRHSVQITPGEITTEKAAFRICNFRDVPLERVRFRPRAFNARRSTPYDLVNPIDSYLRAQGRGGASEVFDSDYIVPADRCFTLTWTGDYHPRDSVAVYVEAFRFADGAQVGYFPY